MKLAIISLDRIELLEDILSAVVEIGITDASVIDSSGLGHVLSERIPIFAGLMNGFSGSSPVRKIIMLLVNDNQVKKIKDLLKDICTDVDEEEITSVLFIPVQDALTIK